MASPTPIPTPARYRFGGYTLDPRERRLLGPRGGVVRLKPRAFDVLLHLVERAGHLVTKEELLASLWPDSVVEESNLAKNVWLVRRALGEPAGEARFVETVTRIGYRFIAPVERIERTAGAEGGADADSYAASDGEDEGDGGGESAAASGAPGQGERGETGEPGHDGEAATAGGGVARVAGRKGRPPRPRRSVAIVATVATVVAALTAMALLVFVGGWRQGRRRQPASIAITATAAPLAPSVATRPAVAVLGFENLTGRADSAWMSMALAEMMSADLAAGERLRLVPGADAMRLAGMLPREAGALTRGALDAARRQLAADFVVKGSYLTLPSPEGEILRIDVLLQSTASGETLVTASGSGASHRLFVLVDGAATRLRGRLGLGAPPVEAAEAAAAALPVGSEATRLYAEGLERLRQYDALGARQALERAIESEPRFPLAHVALSQAVAALGYDQLAIDEAKKAVALAGRLTRAQQLEIAAGLAEAKKDWVAATTTNRSLFAFFPDNLEYGLNLARTLTDGGKAVEALAVLGALRRRPAPASEDPRLDLAEATAQGALSDWQRELASARRAEATARSRHLDWLLGEVLLDEAAAEGSLGQGQAATAARLEAVRLFHAQGNANAEARALLGIATAKQEGADYDGAVADYRQALATFERTGNRQGAAHVWSDLANIEWLAGNVDETLKSAEKELALSREIDDRRGIVWGLGAIGNALADQGELEKALHMQIEALGLSREIGDREYTSFCLGAIADTQFGAGDLDAAQRGYAEALELSRRLQDVSGIGRLQEDLGLVMLAQGRLDEAGRLFEDALRGYQRTADQDDAAQTRMNLAQLRNEQGRPAEALALARQAAQALSAMHQSGNTALALTVAALAEIQLAQSAAAGADCGRARLALRHNHQNQPNLYVLVAEARVAMAAGRLAPARALATEAVATAGRVHLLAPEFEARLVLGEVDLRQHPAAAAKALQALAQEARARRFLLVVRKADALAARATPGMARAPSS